MDNKVLNKIYINSRSASKSANFSRSKLNQNMTNMTFETSEEKELPLSNDNTFYQNQEIYKTYSHKNENSSI